MLPNIGVSQQLGSNYQKRVLESSEIDLLFSYYAQDGRNAAVTGGEGTEELTDATSTIVLKMPVGDDAILTFDAGISAYTSASSSNIDPFDGRNPGNPFDASSGASRTDLLAYFNPAYQKYSQNRNTIWSVNGYVSNEYDYFSAGFGGSIAQLFNEKNTEVSLAANVFLDNWNPQYPIEFRGGFAGSVMNYEPVFTEFSNLNRNSYSASLGFSQILTKKLQGAVFFDVVLQDGLLSTPFQRVYLGDRDDFFVEDFQLADDIERLPETRFKFPVGARLNYYLNDIAVVRSYYRFYFDDWGIRSHTLNLEIPLKLSPRFTAYPSFRYYTQTAADYFFEKEVALSTFEFYTSDFDLSEYNANQYGLGLQYKDLFNRMKLWFFGLKTVDLRYSYYSRNNGLDASILTLSTSFILD